MKPGNALLLKTCIFTAVFFPFFWIGWSILTFTSESGAEYKSHFLVKLGNPVYYTDTTSGRWFPPGLNNIDTMSLALNILAVVFFSFIAALIFSVIINELQLRRTRL